MIKLEQKMLPELQSYTQERAEKLIDLLQSKGTTIARSHCNIEPVSGLKNLQNLQAVLARRQAGFECENCRLPAARFAAVEIRTLNARSDAGGGALRRRAGPDQC